MSEIENIFSGIAFCADCGRAFTRMITCSKDRSKHYFRYICSYCKTHRTDKAQISYMGEQDLVDAVFASITQQIETCAETRRLMEKIHRSQPVIQKMDELENEARKLSQELDRLPSRRMKLYDDYCDGVLAESDYRLFREQYEVEEKRVNARLAEIEVERLCLRPEYVDGNACISAFERFQNEKALTREMLAELVERIEISGALDIRVVFRYMDEYALLDAIIAENGGSMQIDELGTEAIAV